MADAHAPARPADAARRLLLYHFCRLQLPLVRVAPAAFERHLERTRRLYQEKEQRPVPWAEYLDGLYPVDWFLCTGCLDGQKTAWDALFALRTGRSDCLLVDALRARAVRLYPRDEEKQDSAVTEFWSQLLVADREGSLPVLERYDGQRPLAPWLIRVFQNLHLSKLRPGVKPHALPEDDLAMPLPERKDARWHEAFCRAAREWIGTLTDDERLILGLRLRYRLSQREVAALLEIHEGNVGRRTDKLRERCLERIGEQLRAEGWTGDDLAGFVLTEMGELLMDDPRLTADHLARLLQAKGRSLPESLSAG
jgi:RNA polymerase sigma factor (sigma-70 family)